MWRCDQLQEVNCFTLHSGIVLMYFSTGEAEATQQIKGACGPEP